MSKVCVIAGVGPGNGASCCRRFAAEGYSIVMLARNAEYLESLSAQLPGSLPIACDVRDPEAIISAFDRARCEVGEAEVLIYNAGSGEWNSVEETTVDCMWSSCRSNTLGRLVSSPQVIPAITSRRR